MKPAARLTDMHVCPMVTGIVPHVGGPISGPCSPNVLIGFLPAARVSDMCVCVGPPDVIALGAFTVLINGLPAARMGDMCAHGGAIVLGCMTVLIGEGGSGGGGGGGGGGGAAGAGGAVADMADDVNRLVKKASDLAANASTLPAKAVAALASAAKAKPTSSNAPGPAEPVKEEPPEKTFLQVRVVDFDQTPLRGEEVSVMLDSGQRLSGRTGTDGAVRFDNLDPDQGQAVLEKYKEQQADRAAATTPAEAPAAAATPSVAGDKRPAPGAAPVPAEDAPGESTVELGPISDEDIEAVGEATEGGDE